MTDSARSLIDASLRLAQERYVACNVFVGGVRWMSSTAAPAIFVRYGAISHGPPLNTGGQDASVYTESQELILKILGRDEEDARGLKNAILRAFRDTNTVSGGVAPGNFRWLTEDEPGYSRAGAALTGSIVVLLPVPKYEEPQQTAEVLSTNFTAEFEDS